MRIAIALFLSACIGNAWAAGPGGAWSWDQGQAGYYAGTSNDTGDTFGQACYIGERRCYWLIGLKRTCRTKATHPILVNTDAGASTFQITCMGQSDDGSSYRYAISEFDDIDRVVSTATRIGFALPLQGDQFLVIRFDLSGSKQMVSAMRQAALAQMQAAPK